MNNIRNKIYVCDVCNGHFSSPCNLDLHKMKQLPNGYYSCAISENGYMDNDVHKLQEAEHTIQMQYSDNISNDIKYLSLLNTEHSCSLDEQHNVYSTYRPSASVSGIHFEETVNNYVDTRSHFCSICDEAFQKNVDLCLHLKCHNIEKSALMLDHQLNLASHCDHASHGTKMCDVTSDQMDRTMHISKHSVETKRKSIIDQTVMNCPQIEGDHLAQLVKQYNVFNLRKSVNSNNVCMSVGKHAEDNISCLEDHPTIARFTSDFDSSSFAINPSRESTPRSPGERKFDLPSNQNVQSALNSENSLSMSEESKVELSFNENTSNQPQGNIPFMPEKGTIQPSSTSSYENDLSVDNSPLRSENDANNNDSFALSHNEESKLSVSDIKPDVILNDNSDDDDGYALSHNEESKLSEPDIEPDINLNDNSDDDALSHNEDSTLSVSDNEPDVILNENSDDDALSHNEDSTLSASDIEPDVSSNDNSSSHNEERKSISDIEPDVNLNDNSEDNRQLFDSTSTENLTNDDEPLDDNAYNMKATSLPRLLRNRRCHSIADKPHVCDACDKTFKKSHNLIVHSRVHSGRRPFPCNVCAKKFTQNCALQDHMKLHTGFKPYKCCFCEKSFTQKVNMRSHQRVHFQPGTKPYSCTLCDKRFCQANGVQGHMMLHAGWKPHKCGFCDKSFAQKVNMKKHERVHTGAKPYKCNICTSVFAQQNHLKKHSFTHTGERPYKCQICRKSCSQSSNLRTHMMTHTGEKPHKCSFCDKRFNQSSNLHTHIKIHTSPKQYQCVLCQAFFHQVGSLVSHIKRHIRQLKLKCSK